MEQAQSVVGIDVSKKKIDIALLRNGKTKSKALNNTPEGHVELLAWLVDSKVDMATVHICGSCQQRCRVKSCGFS